MKRIGRYEVQAELGRGGFGQVFRAHDPTVGRAVAIKILLAADPDLLLRFRSEAAAAGKLRHRNIITIYDFGEQDKLPYLVMEYLEGSDLERTIAGDRPLSLLQKLDIMSQTASGLHHAHIHGIVHRDIKPANLMILPDGTVKIMDFGIALLSQATAARITPQGSLIGTFPYMAPEQFYGAVSDSITDLFAYGVTCYKLLTGKHPFHAPEMGGLMFNIVNKAPAPIRALVPQCPEALEDAVFKMLAKERDARYQSLEDVKFDLDPIISELRKERIGELITEARSLIDSDEFDNAQPLVHEALEIDAGNRVARELRDEIQRRIKDRKLRPQIEALLEAGRLEIQAQHYEQAIRKFESALRLDKSNTQIHELIQQARSEWEQQQRADRLVAEARHALDSGDITSANKGITDALSAFPEHSQAKSLLSEVRQKLRAREREAFLRDGLARVKGLMLLQSFDAALELLNSLRAEYPESTEITHLLADATHARDAKLRQERLRSNTDEVKALIKNRQFSDAAGLAAKFLREFPESAELADLGSFAAEEDRSQKKAAFVAQVVAETSALVDAGKFDDAIGKLRNALQEHPTASILRERLQSVSSAKSEKLRRETLERTRADAADLIANGAFARALDCITAFTTAFGDSAELDHLRRSAEEELEKQRRIAAIRKLLLQAQGLIDEGRPATASKVLQDATIHFPNDTAVTRLLSVAQDQLREQRRAQEISNIISEAESLARSKKFDESLRALEGSLQRYPNESRLARAKEAILAARTAHEQQAIRTGLLDDVTGLKRTGQLEAALRLIKSFAESESTKFLATDAEFLRLAAQIEAELQEKRRREEIRHTVLRAEALIAEGDFFSATSILKDAAGKNPSDTDLTRLIDVAEEGKREQDRLREIASTLQKARELRNSSQFEAAGDLLRSALAKFPNEANLRKELQVLSDAKQAQDRQQKLASLRAEAQHFLSQNQPQRAVELLRDQISLYPQEQDLADLLRTAERQAGDERKKQAVAKLIEEASALARQGRLADALLCLDAALEKFPNEESLLSLRSEIQSRQVTALAASRAEDLRLALELESALQTVDTALRQVPQDRSLLEIRSRIQADIAARERNQAIEKVINTCLSLLARQRHTEAISDLHQALRRFPNEGRLTDLLSRAQHELAEEQKNREIERIGISAESLLRDGRPEEAIASLENAPILTTALRELLERSRAALTEKQRERTFKDAIGLCEQSRYPEALALLQQGLLQHGASPQITQLLARLEKELEDQRRRGARERDVARLLEIDHQITPNISRRALVRAGRDASNLVAAYPDDSEIAQLGTRIENRIHAALEQKPSRSKLLIPAAASAFVLAVAALLIVPRLLHNKNTPVPVEIRTDPPGASVKLGNRSCVTPNCQFNIEPGQYQLDASLAGYQGVQRPITVYTGKERHFVDLVLEPLPPPPAAIPSVAKTGTLIVKTTQPRALVFVDDVAQKRTDDHGSTTLELPAGTHSVRIAKSGFEPPSEQKIAITARDTQSLKFDLIPEKQASVQPPKISTPPPTTTSAPVAQIPSTSPPPTLSPEAIEAQDWQRAHSSGDATQLRNFLTKYPSSAHIAEAQIQIDDLDWSRVNTSDPQALNAYLSKYPNGRHAREASLRIADLDWMTLDKGNTDALRAYLKQHPDSTYRSQAESLISTIERPRKDQDSQKPAVIPGRTQESFGVDSALAQFNAAFQKKQPGDVKKIWRDVPSQYTDAMRLSGASFVMHLTPVEAPEVSGDTASVRCDLLIISTVRGKSDQKHKDVKVTLQKAGDGWLIIDPLKSP